MLLFYCLSGHSYTQEADFHFDLRMSKAEYVSYEPIIVQCSLKNASAKPQRAIVGLEPSIGRVRFEFSA